MEFKNRQNKIYIGGSKKVLTLDREIDCKGL